MVRLVLAPLHIMNALTGHEHATCHPHHPRLQDGADPTKERDLAYDPHRPLKTVIITLPAQRFRQRVA